MVTAFIKVLNYVVEALDTTDYCAAFRSVFDTADRSILLHVRLSGIVYLRPCHWLFFKLSFRLPAVCVAQWSLIQLSKCQ